ncbi:hypothetical protein RhiirA1_468787 [Rhizophagus irregularis]|uniref:Uncharacterized protein n=1 Tax=Rhizophagus irregularis TaxID=588596 RepID=A0A2N0R9B8_9GLOM|nr:hypothetical protein RhiirA1_468787 [Rhizophagus irregularis]
MRVRYIVYRGPTDGGAEKVYLGDDRLRKRWNSKNVNGKTNTTEKFKFPTKSKEERIVTEEIWIECYEKLKELKM